jgi:hypothetical protein
MGNRLHIVAACSDRKSLPAAVSLRNVEGETARERAREWLRTLKHAAEKKVAAKDLYLGSYWTGVRRVFDEAHQLGYSADLWIASAGYGFVNAADQVTGYAATFSSKHADAVAPAGLSQAVRSEYIRMWWRELADHGLGTGRPRSLTALIEEHRSASVLVVASPDYVGAMEDDLVAAVAHHTERQRIAIISRRSGFPKALENALVPSEAKLQGEWGGTMLTLHPRTAVHVLRTMCGEHLDVDVLRTEIARVMKHAPEYVRPDRTPMDEAAVQHYIKAALHKDPGTSWTRLLRQLRASGQACEQLRFRQIFKDLQGAMNG